MVQLANDESPKTLAGTRTMADNDTDILWSDRKRVLFGLLPSFTKYTLTKELLTVDSGILTSVEDEVRLYRILDIQLVRTLGQKLAGLGTIQVFSADQGLGNFKIENVRNPQKVKTILSNAVEKERMAKRVLNRETMDE